MRRKADPRTIAPRPAGLIAGVDEVGRGPLAGDVVAAAVILPERYELPGLTDSKKLSEARREALAARIREAAVCWCIARASVAEIDKLNILHASLLAMQRAVSGLVMQPAHVYVDGNRLPRWSLSSEAVVGGDALIDEISAASILAKVCRDREMEVLAQTYPGYGFEKHKGYPTREHLAALARLGVTPIHRQSFAPVRQAVAQSSLDLE